MIINDFLKDDLVLNLKEKTFKNKKDVLKYLSKVLVDKKYAKNSEKVLELALKREDEFSTGVGNKVAIPHIRDDVMEQSVVLFAKVKPIDWNSIDNEKVSYVFFIAINKNDGENSHMEIIANLSRLLINPKFIEKLSKITSYKTLLNLINEFMSLEDSNAQSIEKSNDNVNKVNKQALNQSDTKSNDAYDVVAITACPTGIAHTFMAAQRLENTAKEMNIKIKVETQGTDGNKNVLTQEDIKNAKGVILATDKLIDTSRFAGKDNVLEMGTNAVIKDPKKEINKILNNEGKKFAGDANNVNNKSSFDSNEDLISFNKFGKRIYKALMTGVSFMLPFVIVGGILIAIAFLIDINNAGNANYGSVSPAAKWFKTLGGLSFELIVPILAAYMTYAFVGKFGLLPGFLVGMIANGKFVFAINPETGIIDWTATPTANSGFFGAIFGAILAAAILIASIKYIFNKMPKSLNGIKNILLIPLFTTFVIVSIFYVINIPLIYLNYGFTKLLTILSSNIGLAILLGFIVGLMMTFDLGGPVNKAAYVFATASLSSTTNGVLNSSNGGTLVMAAVMAAGMIPPLGIAMSTTFFRRKIWSQQDIESGYSNWIMGLSFVSEGAIPFTAERPKLLVPCNLIGGAVAGILTAAFAIKLNAPHGGIFVFALVQCDWYPLGSSLAIGAGIGLYLLAIIAGAIAEMLAIWVLSKFIKTPTSDIEKSPKTTKQSWKKVFSFSKKKSKDINYKNNLNKKLFNLNINNYYKSTNCSYNNYRNI